MQAIITFFIRNRFSLLKFALVGATGLGIDFSVTWLLRDIFFINDYLSGGGGFVIAAISNYYFNSRWTFKKHATAPARQFLLFFSIAVVGLGMHLVLLYIFLGLHISFYIGKVLAIGCVLVWNFTANSLITFRTKKANRPVSPTIQESQYQPESATVCSNPVQLTGFILLFLVSSCNENSDSAEYRIPVDSFGIGPKNQFYELPGRFIAFNPDSANKVIILGEKGKRINIIYKGTGSPDHPLSINNLAVDAATMGIYIYSPLQHSVFVYDADGNYKKKIPIPEGEYNRFFLINDRFVFTDKKDKAKLYMFDSTGQYVERW